MAKPTLLVLSGMPGTGKSALAARIAKHVRLPIFSVDPIESAILDSGIARSFETGLAAYQAAIALADAQLQLGQGAIVDAVNGVSWAKRQWRQLAKRRGAKLRIIECVCSNERLHRSRLARRRRGLTVREPTWDDVSTRKAEWVPWKERVLVVDSAEPLAGNVTRAVRWVRGGSTRESVSTT